METGQYFGALPAPEALTGWRRPLLRTCCSSTSSHSFLRPPTVLFSRALPAKPLPANLRVWPVSQGICSSTGRQKNKKQKYVPVHRERKSSKSLCDTDFGAPVPSHLSIANGDFLKWTLSVSSEIWDQFGHHIICTKKKWKTFSLSYSRQGTQ